MIDVRNSTLGVWVSAREVLISRAAIEGLAFCFLEMVEERIQNAAQDSVDLTEQFLQGLTRLEKAQLLVVDLVRAGVAEFSNLDRLTCLADYRLPRVLRHLGILEYEEELAQKVDGGQELKAGSSAEIEIRAATIWAVELLRVRLEPVRTAPELDQKLYLLDKVLERKLGDKYPPHHQVRTIFY